MYHLHPLGTGGTSRPLLAGTSHDSTIGNMLRLLWLNRVLFLMPSQYISYPFKKLFAEK